MMEGGDAVQPSSLAVFFRRAGQSYQRMLDVWTPYTLARWLGAVLLLVAFLGRILYLQGWYIITYALGIYHLNLFIAFLTPKVDPALGTDDYEDGPELPTKVNEEFRPFIRRLPEFKFWYSATKATLVAIACTFFDAFNVPVFWPILLLYFITLFCLTMKRQIKELKFLGHVVSPRGVWPDPEKLAAVAEVPRPSDKKAVQRFLGLCVYYCRFVEGFSRIAEPLTRLTRQDVPFEWTEEQQKAFTGLRKRLLIAPVLAHFDDKADTEIHTDASNVGLGAILVQWQDGAERVLAYASRSLTKAECLAVVWAIGKFRPYLYGRPFRIVSDHHSLRVLGTLQAASLIGASTFRSTTSQWYIDLDRSTATLTSSHVHLYLGSPVT